MADVLSATCDICGVIKKEANHWYRVWKNRDDVIGIAPWSLPMEEMRHQHACGEDHALKLAARLLGKSSGVGLGAEAAADSVGERGKP
jgi:hypothetical protein